MRKPKETELEIQSPVVDGEDEITVAAIDEGLRDAKAGRAVTLEKVRELLPKWISESSSPRKR